MLPAGADRDWSVDAALRQLRTIHREQGARAAAMRGLSELCYRRLTVIERALDAPIEAVGTDLEVEVRPLHPAELDTAPATPMEPGEPASGDDRLCYAVLDPAGQVLHSCWVAFGRARVPYLRAELDLAPGTAFVFDAVTAVAARGHGLSAVRSAAMLADLRERGMARAIAALLPENPAAAPPTRRVGYRPVGRISVAWLGTRRRYRAKLPAGLIMGLRAARLKAGESGNLPGGVELRQRP